MVDECHLHEHGGHGGRVEDDELWPFLDAAVFRAERGRDLPLDGARQPLRLAAARVDQRLRAVCFAVCRIAVQAHEYVGAPLVRLVRHGGVPALKVAALPREVVALHEKHLHADEFQIELHARADVGCDIALAESKRRIDRAAVVKGIVPRIQEYTHTCHSFPHTLRFRTLRCCKRLFLRFKRIHAGRGRDISLYPTPRRRQLVLRQGDGASCRDWLTYSIIVLREVFDMLNFVWDQERALEVRAEEAREDGIKAGLSQGVLETTISAIRSMMKNLGLSMEKAMDVLQIPADERAKYAMLIKG